MRFQASFLAGLILSEQCWDPNVPRSYLLQLEFLARFECGNVLEIKWSGHQQGSSCVKLN